MVALLNDRPQVQAGPNGVVITAPAQAAPAETPNPASATPPAAAPTPETQNPPAQPAPAAQAGAQTGAPADGAKAPDVVGGLFDFPVFGLRLHGIDDVCNSLQPVKSECLDSHGHLLPGEPLLALIYGLHRMIEKR